MSYTIKLCGRILEATLRKDVDMCAQQYGSVSRKSTADAIFLH